MTSELKQLYAGVDPGKSGAIAILDRTGDVVSVIKLSETERDVADGVALLANRIRFALLEKVHSMPKQGLSSTFKFGRSYGFCRGLLISYQIPFEELIPAKWQSVMKCRSGGDKKITKARAQELFPKWKVIHATADALLLAELCRRQHEAWEEAA